MTKRKSLNPVIIVLNRNFNEISSEMIFALVFKSEDQITMKKIVDTKEVCSIVKEMIQSDQDENVELSVYVKQPFTKEFVSAKKIISNAMKHFYPDFKVELSNFNEVQTENDEVQTEIMEVIEVTEVAPKKSKKK